MTYLIIGVVVVILIVVALVVVLGLLRQKSKTITFAEDESPKELTQQEKSENYQASGGFNFAPANAPQPEPEVLRGQRFEESTPVSRAQHEVAEGQAGAADSLSSGPAIPPERPGPKHAEVERTPQVEASMPTAHCAFRKWRHFSAGKMTWWSSTYRATSRFCPLRSSAKWRKP